MEAADLRALLARRPSVEVAAKFKQMLDDQMRSGRELLKVQLPFGTAENARFTDEALEERVKTMKKIRADWGG